VDQALLKKANKLAAKSYLTVVTLDETTDGQPVYFARNLELPNCLGQGFTYEEAVQDLLLARIDYIYSLLEDDLPVPDPSHLAYAVSTQPKPKTMNGIPSPESVEVVLLSPSLIVS